MVPLSRFKILIILLLLSAAVGCGEVAVPRPRGHFRIDLPDHKYILFDGLGGKNLKVPLSFEFPVYGQPHLSS